MYIQINKKNFLFICFLIFIFYINNEYLITNNQKLCVNETIINIKKNEKNKFKFNENIIEFVEYWENDFFYVTKRRKKGNHSLNGNFTFFYIYVDFLIENKRHYKNINGFKTNSYNGYGTCAFNNKYYYFKLNCICKDFYNNVTKLFIYKNCKNILSSYNICNLNNHINLISWLSNMKIYYFFIIIIILLIFI